jgi:uncharacterized protein affecting Mg2+/Co2+ transport
MVGLIESKYMKENEIDEEEKFMYLYHITIQIAVHTK